MTMRNGIHLSEREQEILRFLALDGHVSVGRISKHLKVSQVTVRSDLNALEEKGFVVRTHGGAVPAFHKGVIERQKEHVAEKERIARRAAELIANGDSVMISAGTTTSLIPKYLIGKRDIQIVTNSTFILPYIRINPMVDVIFVGGEFKASGEAMVGPLALHTMEQFHVKKAFIGADGFSLEHGITAHLVELAEAVKKMAEQADEVVILSDSSKFAKVGFARIAPVTKIDCIITDDGLAPAEQARFEKKGICVERV